MSMTLCPSTSRSPRIAAKRRTHLTEPVQVQARRIVASLYVGTLPSMSHSGQLPTGTRKGPRHQCSVNHQSQDNYTAFAMFDFRLGRKR